jgi:hypothetical protein
LTVDKGGGAARAEVTKSGRFYLRHGRYPDAPELADRSEPSVPAESSTPYSDRPVARARRAKARELVDRLVAEGHVRFAYADGEETAEWRRVVNYAKRHGMEPEGKRIEKVPYGLLGGTALLPADLLGSRFMWDLGRPLREDEGKEPAVDDDGQRVDSLSVVEIGPGFYGMAAALGLGQKRVHDPRGPIAQRM